MHRGERRGFAVLLAACLLAAAWVIYEQWWRPGHPERVAQLQLAWLQWEAERPDSVGNYPARAPRSVELFAFDPNGLPKERWVALGLSPRQAEAILRYEAGGGRFRSKHDVARMRVVDPALYERWAPYIQLPDSLPRAGHGDFADGAPRTQAWPREEGKEAPRSTHARIDVNTADTTLLVQVRGIGPAFARGIVKYRDRLGGFRSLDQLGEVHILRDKPDAVARLKEELLLDTLMLRRLPVNSLTAEELGQHPYAGWKVARALVAYRKMHGPFRELKDIKGCVLVTDSIYRKLAPYLTVE
ncbi:MAG: helix-hairpin-helix domain-containing protein [Flavobacteriales bacterium]